ncbi:MAG: hypothetical protein CBD76_00275 [Pelagibacteraceae bacterium TMED216]|nr:MAG: hypothetical protein CBD76_00275 [Pelagibacteraceae bacterium TMED216]|tara:strand:- start:2003 stop:2629 length:627 start_codon:yes stop_codon:yes gene_type:complete
MPDYKKKKENQYWNDYYNSKTKRHPNSEFSEFVLDKIEKESSLIDIGCGDGRDTHFFSENKIFSKGIDFSQETIKQNKPLSNKYLSFEHMDLQSINELHETFDYAYCRFIFHSITEKIESKLLFWLSSNIKKNIFIETRILDFENREENLNHYRRFFSEDDLINKMKKNKLIVNYSETSYNFSKYREIYKVKDLTKDPLILRLIISPK